MDTQKLLADCSTSSIPYRYDLRAGGNYGISYFVDNGLTQRLVGAQDGWPREVPSDMEILGCGCQVMKTLDKIPRFKVFL